MLIRTPLRLLCRFVQLEVAPPPMDEGEEGEASGTAGEDHEKSARASCGSRAEACTFLVQPPLSHPSRSRSNRSSPRSHSRFKPT